MPPIDALLETALYVDDVERSVEFYQRVFGFAVIDAGDRLTAMSVVGRHVLLLCRRGASLQLGPTAHDCQGQSHLALAVPAGALDEWRAWLASHAVPIVEERQWPRGGRSLYFRDPDGHLLEIATPGVWTIY